MVTKSFAETYDNWPDVLACAADGTWRLIRSKDDKPATQWIIQRRSGEQWSGRMFFQSGDAMRRYRQQLRMTNRSSTRLARGIDIGSIPIAKREWTPADMVARGTDRVIFQLLPIVGGALSAPLIGMIFEAMIRHGWLGLDQAYAVYPISAIALAALISVVPLAVIVIRIHRSPKGGTSR